MILVEEKTLHWKRKEDLKQETKGPATFELTSLTPVVEIEVRELNLHTLL